MAKTSKNRSKAIKENRNKAKLFETYNGDLADIDYNRIKKAFPNVQERQEYISALISGL
jgi:hypothetical protein